MNNGVSMLYLTQLIFSYNLVSLTSPLSSSSLKKIWKCSLGKVHFISIYSTYKKHDSEGVIQVGNIARKERAEEE